MNLLHLKRYFTDASPDEIENKTTIREEAGIKLVIFIETSKCNIE